MKMSKLVHMYIGYALMVAVNALANIIPINGYQTGEISDMQTVFFTPAGYVFSIWGIIYIGLLVWLLLFSFKKQTLTNAQYWAFLLSCFFNAAWILAWHYLQSGLALVIILLLLAVLIYFYIVQRKSPNPKIYSIPVSLYLGWIIVAAITNGMYWLVATDAVSASTHVILTFLFLTVATLIGIAFAFFLKDWAVILVFVWAMTGIAIKNWSMQRGIAFAAILLTVLLILLSASLFLSNRRSSKAKNKIR